MRTCVTGGAGFIGSHLAERLVADGHEVAVLDDLSTGDREHLAPVWGRIAFHEDDLRDLEAVRRAVEGCEVVFHLGALAAVARSVERPAEVHEVNVGGTLNVLLAARDAGVRRVVFASSSSVYGDTPTLPKTETMALTPRSPYAATKAAGEAYAGAFDAVYDLETVALRFFNVYGPRQSPRSLYAAVVPRFIEAMADGRPPVLYGDGEQTRDFTFVGDVVDAVVRAGDAPRARGTALNVGGGRRISIRALADVIAEETGFEGEPEHAAPRPGDVRDSLADVERARDLLGWRPTVDLREGIARTVAAARAVGRR